MSGGFVVPNAGGFSWQAVAEDGGSLGFYESEPAARAALAREAEEAQHRRTLRAVELLKSLSPDIAAQLTPRLPDESKLQYRLRTGKAREP